MPKSSFSIFHKIPNFADFTSHQTQPEIHCGLKCCLEINRIADTWEIKIDCRKRSGSSREICSDISLFLGESSEPLLVGKYAWYTDISCPFSGGIQKKIEKYTKNGSLSIRIDVVFERKGSGNKYDFTRPNDLTDVTLIVQQQKFHVSKIMLATSSQYFKTMFFEKFRESNQSEITLNDVDVTCFQMLLEVVYHKETITVKNARELLELVLYFGFDDLKKQCIDAIVNSTDNQISKYEKIQLYDEFELFDLLAKLLDGISNFSALKSLIPDNLDYLKPETVKALLKRVKTVRAGSLI